MDPPPIKSHVNHVVLDGPRGNSWEEEVAQILEGHSRVAAYVKNDHLGFEIPYVHEGRTHRYVPDFLVRLVRADDDPVESRTLIVEVSGGRKKAHDPVPVAVKATTARDRWCRSVNNYGGYGRWGYVELTDRQFAGPLNQAIEQLEADGLVTGLPD
jgi:type III restriction enzyme